jgi:hypothetical protein
MPSLKHDHRALAFLIAAEADVDPRSVSAVISGKRVKGPAGRRIARALERRGIVDLMECERPPADQMGSLSQETEQNALSTSAGRAQGAGRNITAPLTAPQPADHAAGHGAHG